ncbi:phosphatase PAP2 family protein [Dokdonia sinensis]|uniref:Phosphatase PAP2 family protein n=1 Tax=Dokdonia sinensis TaxID=2479847 RepID=A0A3M0G0B1_9FLAO|nr:phosphatase PAP2 family protein [Dokdonia sinensis]RMB57617.1 phosphatase PAP2 family protein [Dokdonia sinensis]
MLLNYRILFILFCAFSISKSVYSQTAIPSNVQDTLSIWQLAKYDAKAAVLGVGHAYSRPLYWDGKDWTTFGIVAGGTALLYFVDDETSSYFRRQRDRLPRPLREFGDRFGSPQVAYGLTSSVYLFGLFTKNQKVRETGVLMISSATAAGFLQTVLKASVGRSRPQNGQGKFDFKPFSGQAGWRSFPSGHTILAFTAAYSIAKQFDNPWVKAGIYAVGLISPLSRVWDGAHYLTDVALSMAISIATVDAIDNYLNKNNLYPDGRKKPGISWNLHLGLGRVGIVGSF